MKLKEALKKMPKDEMLYIGMEKAAGYAFIKRICDCDWSDMDKKCRKWLTSRKKNNRKKINRYLRDISVDETLLEFYKHQGKCLDEYKYIKLLDRKVVDLYPQIYDDPKGMIVILEGVEGLGGWWFYHEQKDGIERERK